MAATTTNDLPPWDKSNVEESQPVTGSVYEELLNNAHASLCKGLQLDVLWQYLRELGVINRIKEEQIKHEWVGRERVIALLDLIGHGQRWRFHGLMRSIAQSGQSHLIPKGGVDISIYENYGHQAKTIDSGLKKLQESPKPSPAPKPPIRQKPCQSSKPSSQVSNPVPAHPNTTPSHRSIPLPPHPKPTHPKPSSKLIPPSTDNKPTPTQGSIPPPTKPKPASTQLSSPPPTKPKPMSTQVQIPPPAPPKPVSTAMPILSPVLSKPSVAESTPAAIPQPTLPLKPTLPPKSKLVSAQGLPTKSTLPPKSMLPPRPTKTESLESLPTPPLPPRSIPTSPVRPVQRGLPPAISPSSPSSPAALSGPPPPLYPRDNSDIEEPSTPPISPLSQVSIPPPTPQNTTLTRKPTLPPRLAKASLPNLTLPPTLATTGAFESPPHPLPPRSIPTLLVQPVPRGLPVMPPTSPTDSGAMGGPSVPLYPWDKDNLEECMLVIGSAYAKLLNSSRVDLSNNLQLGCVWPHLRQLNVLKLTDEERLRASTKARPDQVLELLNFIERGPRWHFHALMRAMALTGQGHLIPKGGVGLSIYLEGVRLDETLHVGPQSLASSLLHAIWDHSLHYKRSLMKAHVFNFESNQHEESMDVSECLVHAYPHVKIELTHINGNYKVSVPIKGTKILQEFGGTSAPHTMILYSDQGDGKSTFGKSFVFNWSTNFLDQIIDQGGALSLKGGSQKWTTMVFLKAKSITTTVEAAIRDHLGCKRADEDELMTHIQQGEGVVIVVDDLNELHDAVALEKLENYVQDCQKRRGPTIVITCCIGLCSINARFFDRVLVLKGYTDEEGILYVKLYTEMCEAQKLTQTSQSHLVQDYVTRHKVKLKPILSNPLRLHIFCALAVRGELDLSEQSEFNIPKLLGSLERHLLKRAGVEVNKKQSQDFYRLCIYLLVNDLKEFEEDLLAKFNVVPSYKVFFKVLKSKDRCVGNTVLQSRYSFSNELLLEYFSSQYIYTLDTNKRTSFLLAICSDSYLRNVQKIVFQLLLQDEDSQYTLLQMMLRSMLILQSLPDAPQGGKIKDMLSRFKLSIQSNKSKQVHYDLVSLGEKIKQLTSATIDNILHSKEFKSKDVNGICEKIDSVFDIYPETLTDQGWVDYINENGTFHHVVELLKLCSARLMDIIVQSTMYSLFPGMFTNVNGDKTHIYPTGKTRWAEVTGDTDSELSVTAWCPQDAYEAIVQHEPRDQRWHSLNIYLRQRTLYDNIWGEPAEGSWTKERWDKLLQERPNEGLRMLWILVNETVPLAGLLASLLDDAVQLPHCEVMVPYGTVRLGDLVTCGSGSQRKGLKLTLSSVRVVLPERLRDQRELLWEMIKTCKLVCQDINWVSETGEDIKLR